MDVAQSPQMTLFEPRTLDQRSEGTGITHRQQKP